MLAVLRRGLLLGLAIVLVVATATLAVLDTKADGTNCGSALSPRDTSQSLILSGDADQDNFAQQSLVDRCDRLIFRQRFLTFVGLLVVGVVMAVRVMVPPERTPLPGDPII